MDEAYRVFSREGMLKETVKATDIRSREHARKLWPFVDPSDKRHMVTWVSPSFTDGKRRQKAHFRSLFRGVSIDLEGQFFEDERTRQAEVNESPEHRRAKTLIAAALNRRIYAGRALSWSFLDEDASDFHLEGNLLLGARRAVTEHVLKTPFGATYRLDVTLLSDPLTDGKPPIVLGGVEIEHKHAFDGRKALLAKSIGFPLISVDISEMSLDALNEQWAEQVLTATTRSDDSGRRSTYIYIHDLLYPLYTQIPSFLNKEQKHQFIVFASDAVLDKLRRLLNDSGSTLGYGEHEISAAIVNGKSPTSRLDLERTGQDVGPDWIQYNPNRCLRITVPRPRGMADKQSHLFHIILAFLLLSKTSGLVGYRYRNRAENEDPEEDIWIAKQWLPEGKEYRLHRVLPKRLAEPVNRMFEIITELQRGMDEERGA
jgi:hypothetical protein